MIRVYDVGSLPFEGDYNKLLEGARTYPGETPSSKLFEEAVIKGLRGKLEAGVDVPNFPQYRDMNEMFLEMIEGIEKIENRYYMVGEKLALRGSGVIPEVEVIRRNATRISQEFGEIRLKVCITGPYTLSQLFGYRDPKLFASLGDVLAEITSRSIFKEGRVKVAVISLDEPVFGLVDDPLKDKGSEGREALLKAWEKIFYAAASRGVDTVIHLHSTADTLFLEVSSLRVVESHVDDPLYSSTTLKKSLEEADKFVKASLCKTEFDTLVMERLEKKLGRKPAGEEIADVWRRIKRGAEDPADYLESEDVMAKRLKKILEFYGDRVVYAGPECGLRGFPTYEVAIEYLRRASSATRRVIKTLNVLK